jgi:hypothetical protein
MHRFPTKKTGKRYYEDDEAHAYVKGPLFSKHVLRALLVVFGVFVMLTADWFGLLLLNTEGAIAQLGTLGVLRVTAVLLGVLCVVSVLLSAHYKRMYTYDAQEVVFFDLAFALSFLLGGPCFLVAVFA